MGHKNLIDGVGYDTTGGRCLVDGVGYSIQKGRTLDDGVGYDVAFGTSGIPAGDIAVGSSVYANVNGVRTEFLVVHQGRPSSIYDGSCDGTWLLMKKIYENRAFHSTYDNAYATSTIHSYLNSTFLGLFDSNIKDLIKSIKLPYKANGQASTCQQGANGLSTKIFLLAGPELNYSSVYMWGNDNSKDGSTLSYFSGCAASAADSRRIAYLNGSAAKWWLRTPYRTSSSQQWSVLVNGNLMDDRADYKNGIRPAFVLDSSAAIDPNTFDILG